MLFVEGDVIFYVHKLSVRFLTEDPYSITIISMWHCILPSAVHKNVFHAGL